jgi:hypothetical protein
MDGNQEHEQRSRAGQPRAAGACDADDQRGRHGDLQQS